MRNILKITPRLAKKLKQLSVAPPIKLHWREPMDGSAVDITKSEDDVDKINFVNDIDLKVNYFDALDMLKELVNSLSIRTIKDYKLILMGNPICKKNGYKLLHKWIEDMNTGDEVEMEYMFRHQHGWSKKEKELEMMSKEEVIAFAKENCVNEEHIIALFGLMRSICWEFKLQYEDNYGSNGNYIEGWESLIESIKESEKENKRLNNKYQKGLQFTPTLKPY